MLTMLSVSVWSNIYRHTRFLDLLHSKDQSFLDYAIEFIGVGGILITSISSSFWKTTTWCNLLRKVAKIEEENSKKSNTGYDNIVFVICCVFLLLVTSVFWMKFGIIALYYLSYNGIYFNQFLLAMDIYHIVKTIKNRYIELNFTLKGLKRMKNIKVILETMEMVEIVYIELYDVIIMFNTIFGWPVLALMFSFGLMLMSCILFATAVTGELAVCYILLSIITFIWPLVITFSCDLTTKEAQKIPQRCLKMEKKLIVTPEELAALRSFENRALVHVPKFTAAGFFEINRVTLLTFISNLATYFVVLMQLNSMFNK
ncbi:uncharacterized protein [Diabrotica undecimpunctata]|uniref:uncharacterized protein n=1 Tax=Diabrotica undecimpunctata TaxID=50387 RepID=UPI003B641981